MTEPKEELKNLHRKKVLEVTNAAFSALNKSYRSDPQNFNLAKEIADIHLQRAVSYIVIPERQTKRAVVLPQRIPSDTPRFIGWPSPALRFVSAPNAIKGVHVETNELIEAKARYTDLTRRYSNLALGYLGLGICNMIDAFQLLSEGNKDAKDKARSLLNIATNDFDTARLNSERMAPAYLYGALTNFVLISSFGDQASDKSQTIMRRRQAFYRLEHFIDQTLQPIIFPDLPFNDFAQVRDTETSIDLTENFKNASKDDNGSRQFSKDDEVLLRGELIRQWFQQGEDPSEDPNNEVGKFYFDPADVPIVNDSPLTCIAQFERILCFTPIVATLLSKDLEEEISKVRASGKPAAVDVQRLIAYRAKMILIDKVLEQNESG